MVTIYHMHVFHSYFIVRFSASSVAMFKMRRHHVVSVPTLTTVLNLRLARAS